MPPPKNGSASPRDQGGTNRPSKRSACVKGYILELVIGALRWLEVPFEFIFWAIHSLRCRIETAVLILRQ